MFGANVQVTDTTKNVVQAAEKAAYRNFGHASASIRKDAQASIKPAPKEQRTRAKKRGGKIVRRATHAASPPGQPPFTKRGQLKRSITFSADKESAVIGPRHSVMDIGAAAHEHGGTRGGATFPARPFMYPALERNLSRFAESWRHSIGQ